MSSPELRKLRDILGELTDVDEELALLRSALETVSDGVICASPDNLITFCNHGAAQMLAWEQDELIGQSLMVIMPERYRERHIRSFSRFLETGETRIQGNLLQIEALRKDGTEIPIYLRITSYQVNGHRYFTGTIRPRTGALVAP